MHDATSFLWEDSASAFVATARKQAPPATSIKNNFIESTCDGLDENWEVDIQLSCGDDRNSPGVFAETGLKDIERVNNFPLSHRMGEGRGEGFCTNISEVTGAPSPV